MNQEELRKIPSVDQVLGEDVFPEALPRPLRKYVVSRSLEEVRDSVKEGADCPPREQLLARIADEAKSLIDNKIRPVLNGTGVVLHTNLGRAPYARSAVEALEEVTSGYSSLEIDVSTGERGGRGAFAEQLLCRMTGAEAAGIVNNCSGALVLALQAIARGKDVLISRGELVQIGGGFRIPDVLEASGSELREVGTTNRTSLEDYEQELDEDVGMILRVHRSNFDLVGFTESASHEALADLASKEDVPFVCDLGSGSLWDTSSAGVEKEPRPGDVLEKGADLVVFSGDKLLGGPQAGLFLGQSSTVEAMKEHAFFRALRGGKATLSALEATLAAYAENREGDLPVVRQLRESPEAMEERVRSVFRELGDPESVEVTSMEATVGGGCLPEAKLESRGLAFRAEDPGNLLDRMRDLDPPLIGRLRDDRVLVNFRTILPGEESALVESLAALLPLSVES
jgi:L-seryl-tRNA(Ser) seleniumtransferase